MTIKAACVHFCYYGNSTITFCYKLLNRHKIKNLHNTVMQYILGGSLHKNNTSQLLLGLYHASVNWISIVLMQITVARLSEQGVPSSILGGFNVCFHFPLTRVAIALNMRETSTDRGRGVKGVPSASIDTSFVTDGTTDVK